MDYFLLLNEIYQYKVELHIWKSDRMTLNVIHWAGMEIFTVLSSVIGCWGPDGEGERVGVSRIIRGGRVFETIVEPTGENREHKFCIREWFSLNTENQGKINWNWFDVWNESNLLNGGCPDYTHDRKKMYHWIICLTLRLREAPRSLFQLRLIKYNNVINQS